MKVRKYPINKCPKDFVFHSLSWGENCLCWPGWVPEMGPRSRVSRAGLVREEENERAKGEAMGEGSEEGKVESVSQERFTARGQSARRTGLFQEQSVNPH